MLLKAFDDTPNVISARSFRAAIAQGSKFGFLSGLLLFNHGDLGILTLPIVPGILSRKFTISERRPPGEKKIKKVPFQSQAMARSPAMSLWKRVPSIVIEEDGADVDGSFDTRTSSAGGNTYTESPPSAAVRGAESTDRWSPTQGIVDLDAAMTTLGSGGYGATDDDDETVQTAATLDDNLSPRQARLAKRKQAREERAKANAVRKEERAKAKADKRELRRLVLERRAADNAEKRAARDETRRTAGEAKIAQGPSKKQQTTQSFSEGPQNSKLKPKPKGETLMESLETKATTRVVDLMVAKYDAWVWTRRVFYVDDPWVPACIRGALAFVWDLFEPHFRDEFISSLEFEMGLRKRRRDSIDHMVSFHNDSNKMSLRKIRLTILYTLYPYDKTVWRAMHRPLWWALLMLRSCPVFGVSSFSFAAVLALIDRQDSYQLVQFILVFKKFQFWITGLAGLLFISGAYTYCIVVDNPRYADYCGEHGPGTFELGALSSSLVTYPVVVGFVFQVFLLWVALYLIRFSIPKGGSVRRGLRLVGDVVYWEEHTMARTGKEKQRKVVVRGKVVAYDRKSGLHTVKLEGQANGTAGSNGNGREQEKEKADRALERGIDARMAEQQGGGSVQVPLHHMRYFVNQVRLRLEVALSTCFDYNG